MNTPSVIRIFIHTGLLLAAISLLSFRAHGAVGDVDLSFDPGSGINGPVHAVVVQPDGKLLIGGAFSTVSGLKRGGVARLNADGSGDGSFNPPPGVAGYYGLLVLQPDGKVLVRNWFSSVVRLHADGNLDGSFSPDLPQGVLLGFEDSVKVTALVVQPDGKMVVGGYSENYDCVGGDCFVYDGYFVVRLHPDGSRDTGFEPVLWDLQVFTEREQVKTLALQPDGKVVVGGNFYSIKGTNRTTLARLNADGSLDDSFISPTTPYVASSITMQPDGKLLVVSRGVFRLNANGSLDSTFNPGTGPTGPDFNGLRPVALQSDGKVLIGGDFTAVNGTDRKGVARLLADGNLDSTFNPGSGANAVNRIALQSDGKVLIGGGFTTVDGALSGRMARLNGDGSLDSGFHPGAGVGNSVRTLAIQPDGRVLIGGDAPIRFAFINGTNQYGSARLHADGSPDHTFITSSFNPDLAFVLPTGDCPADPDLECSRTWATSAVLVQPDGKVLIGGTSSTRISYRANGEEFYTLSRSFLVRVHADDSRDMSYAPVLSASSSIGAVSASALAVQPDGKVLVAGPGLTRRHADGTPDNSFSSGIILGVAAMAVQPDGKLLIGGEFSTLHGTTLSFGIARLNANGTPDSSFHPEIASTGYGVSALALQSDGKVLIGGAFQTVGGTNRSGIARLNSDGSLDSSFHPGTGADGHVSSIAIQPDGNILIGGHFTAVNGSVRPYVARLYGDAASPAGFAAWTASFGLSAGSAAANADPDHDGLPNGVEYVLGEDPLVTRTTAATSTGRPLVTVSGGNMLYTFLRDDASETPGVSLKVENGLDLISWPNVFAIGADTAGSSPGVTIIENGTAPDTITVAIPMETTRAMFARLKVTITP